MEGVQPILLATEAPGHQSSYGTMGSLPQQFDSSRCTESDSGDASDDRSEATCYRAKGLKETEGWLGYLNSFSIFIPYLIPWRDRKIQACIATRGLCLVGKRVFNVLIPRQFGVVVDALSTTEMPYFSLAIYFLLTWLHGDCGLGLIQARVEVPIKQFSYCQVSNTAFSHVMRLSMDFHSDKDSAELIKAVEQGEALSDVLDTIIFEILPAFIDIIIALVVLYWKFNFSVSFALLIASAVFMSVQIFMTKWSMESRRNVTRAQREQTQVMYQAVQGWQTVACFNKFNDEERDFSAAVESLLEASEIWNKRGAYTTALSAAIICVSFFALASLVLYGIPQRRSSAGDFIFFASYWRNLTYPLELLSHHYCYFSTDLVDAERLLNLLQTKPTIVDKLDAESLRQVKGYVKFENVCFSYDRRNPFIQDLSISAAPGETIAIVGVTGAGKSTLISLLLRYYDVTSGQITVDGHNIQNVTMSSLRDALGVVPQNPFLFNTSIMENLRYARPSATDDQVFKACRCAAIHDNILALPDGYHTRVGEQGAKLSGGEIQRLAIARVFLKDAPILILDEATSAVDVGTESEIQATLNELKRQRTTITIAHRLSTVVNADQIHVVHDGMVVERGTHNELLESKGRYWDLWEKQVR